MASNVPHGRKPLLRKEEYLRPKRSHKPMKTVASSLEVVKVCVCDRFPETCRAHA